MPLETGFLEEAKTFEVREVLSALKKLTENTEESEARLAREILLRRDSSTVVGIMLNNFARQVQKVVSNCYKAVANIKSQQVKMVSLEREFLRQRSDKKLKRFENWRTLVGMEVVQRKKAVLYSNMFCSMYRAML